MGIFGYKGWSVPLTTQFEASVVFSSFLWLNDTLL